ncbi:unnamed protein product [Penicillium nalgiovense]|uniref:BZIP domain-containing protein n=1 Tax=Penicillium nalgiovense TaxID=60175 RepID=A0A9W4HNU6_PENNA|nr:unnamed protein product [Penicillium nalgiovense]CAG7958897.1 unnamed protein product [Penicillium nalgiovense]CAG7998362.1 unnamed protein product [Penicillium nalgiovense]CAG8022793.1 unnamed protein product [Penicillium nalgiovense]CAG8024831.1 unnamed protein product [Penicillium nalgiovense]
MIFVIRTPVLGENWANISDPVERRRAQNRIAQRGYRKRLRRGDENPTSQNSTQTEATAKSAAGGLSSPLDSKYCQPGAPQQQPAVGPQSSGQWPSQPYAHPHHHIQQQDPPQLPSDLHSYTSQLDQVGLTGSPWAQSLDEDTHQIFNLKTMGPGSDSLSTSPKNQAHPFQTSIDTDLLCSTPAPPLLHTPRGTPDSTGSSTTRGPDGAHGHTALHRAALYGHESVLAVLLQAGADPALPDSTGFTPLHLAAQQGHAGIVRLLLSSSPSRDLISWVTRKGETALHIAVQAQQPGVVRVLIEHSARAVNDQDWWGRTALHMACESNQQELVEMLVHAGAQLDIPDFEGQTRGCDGCIGAVL